MTYFCTACETVHDEDQVTIRHGQFTCPNPTCQATIEVLEEVSHVAAKAEG